jgi:hypothetical protein
MLLRYFIKMAFLMQNKISRFYKACFKKTHVVHVVIILLCAVIIYWPVYNFKFLIGWDDQWFVTNHYTENGFTWHNLSSILADYYYGQYAPLNQLYYTSLYKLFHYNAGYYHIAGLVIHLINSVLVYDFIKSITADLSDFSAAKAGQTAFIAALLFAVLPVNVEPVAWVGASKVTLYTLFYLLAIGCYRKYIIRRRQSFFYLALLFFILSFGAKEQAVLLPLCLLLMDHVYSRNIRDKMVWLEKIPFFMLSVLFGMVSIQAQNIDGGASFYSVYQRIPLFFYTISEYFTKCIIPVNLSYLYPFPFQRTQSVPWWMWAHTFFIPIILFCFYKQIARRWFLFGFLFFVIHILLVSNAFSLARFSVIADRYAYLASIGFCFIAGYAFVNYSSKVKYKRFLVAAGLVYIVALMTYAHSHLMVWRSAYSLKEKLKTTIEKRPDFNELRVKYN